MALVVGAATHLRSQCPKTYFPSSSTIKSLRHAQSQFSPYFFSHRLPPCLFYSSRRNPRLLNFSAAAVSVEKTEKDRFAITVTEAKQPRSSVPGFRPGRKVPENILINFVGRHNIQQAVIEEILKKTLPQAMVSVEGRALKDSVRIVTKFAEMYDTFSPDDYFRYEVVVDVAPEIKWLTEAKYKNLKVIVQIDKTITAEIASEIEFRHRHKAQGSLRIVTDRGLQIGDLVVLDILATRIEGDLSIGENIPSAERKGFHLDTEESDNLLPGFVNSIVGIRQGETKSFPLQFPESWEQVNLRGVQAQFTVECKELFYRDLPKLDDSLAENLFPGCSSLDQVRETILQRCKEVEQTAIEQATDNAILEQLSKIVEVDIPQSLFDEQGRQLYGARLLQLQAGRKVNEQQLSSLSSEKAVKGYLENQKENITSIIKQMLAVGEIFQCENLQYSTAELVKEVQNSVEEFKRLNQEYDEERVRQQVQDILEGAKVLEWLRENSDIRYVFR